MKDNYTIPITLEFIGFNGDIFGIRASTYDPKTTSQSSGFFVVSNLFKNYDEKTFGIKKVKKKFWRSKEYQKAYEILHFYDLIGFKILREKIVKVKDGQPMIKKNRISGSYISSFHSADYYFGLKNILNHFDLDPTKIEV